MSTHQDTLESRPAKIQKIEPQEQEQEPEQEQEQEFGFFDNLFAEFIENLLIILYQRAAARFLSTCKKLQQFRKSDQVVLGILKRAAQTSEASMAINAENFYKGSIGGYLMQNYYSLVMRTFVATRNKHDYFPNSEAPEYAEIFKNAKLYYEESNAFSVHTCSRLLNFLIAPIFKVYSRLIPYAVGEQYKYIKDVHKAFHLFQPRALHGIEQTLFTEVDPQNKIQPTEVPLVDIVQFRKNMETHFRMDLWEKLIDWNYFAVVGGSVLKCILMDSFVSLTPQDVDFFWVNTNSRSISSRTKKGRYKDYYSFGTEVDTFAAHFEKLFGKEHVVNTDMNNYVRNVAVTIPSTADTPARTFSFQFIWYDQRISPSEVLYLFDLDCCQVGFNGSEVYCTFPFVQSISTRTMINYKLVNDVLDLATFMPRTQKYQKRGFSLLVPKKFDTALLGATYEVNKQKKASDRSGNYGFLLNNDSLLVKNSFLKIIDPDIQLPSEKEVQLPPPFGTKEISEYDFGSDEELKEELQPESYDSDMSPPF